MGGTYRHLAGFSFPFKDEAFYDDATSVYVIAANNASKSSDEIQVAGK